jgi:periplasmic divalent cation tolerance protein
LWAAVGFVARPRCNLLERMGDEIVLALSTFPDEETAHRIATKLVTENFAACANILPVVNSIYRWQGKIESGREVVVFFKTAENRRGVFQETLRALHPYEVPEIIFIPVTAGLPEYLRWVVDNSR